ncbi:acetolactate synthase-like protein [Tetranychus urticae]|uniref:2-hydroxyacyl-CoA lyase 2 n=1 Tax=Tetranychus urticae TaxID=32264 RepID=T1KTR1_TETUR|nr:acetolactate synthase-like protein [Tetranychus urticae]
MESTAWTNMDELSKGFREILSQSLSDFDPFSSFKTALFYILITVSAMQTFYPFLMIMAMVIRQLSILAHYFHEVDEDSKKHGGQLIATVFKTHGVEQVFTLSGGHISPILTGCQEQEIRVIDVRHEASAVFAADAAARVSGIPGVAIVTAGPGLTNTITPTQNAFMAESPVVIISGSTATLAKGRGALQDIDQMSLMKPITKWQASVSKVRDLVPTIREAFRQAQSNTPGPVFVECPLDVLYPYKVVRREIMGKARASTFTQKVVTWYLDQYTKNLFAGAFDMDQETRPWPVELPFPKSNDIYKAVEIVSKAKKPLIVLGSQSILPPVGGEKLSEVIKSLGIPCYLGGMSRGLLGQSSSLHMRHCRREALREADVVILAGTVADFRLDYGRVLSSRSKVIAVNRNKSQLKKNHKFFWNAELLVQADVGKFFLNLTEKLGQFSVDPEWINTLRERDSKRDAEILSKSSAPTDKHLNPLSVLTKLESLLPEDTYIIADGGDFVGTASYILKPRGPLRWLDPGVFGTLGCGGGFAIGVKAVRPKSNVVIIFGDGALGFSFMEYDTMVRHKLNVVSIVGNDAGWTQIEREQVVILGSDVACKLAYTAYEEAARALGAEGFKIDRTNETEMESIISKSLEIARTSSPVLINTLIGRTDFRDGSISV